MDWVRLELTPHGLKIRCSNLLSYQSNCGAGRTRTADLLVMSQVSYQLLYRAINLNQSSLSMAATFMYFLHRRHLWRNKPFVCRLSISKSFCPQQGHTASLLRSLPSVWSVSFFAIMFISAYYHRKIRFIFL